MGLPKNVLVPVDFATPSLRACERAAAIARDLRARVILLHVVDAPGAERRMRALANDLHPPGCAIETRIVEGTPWRAIVAAIEAEHADLVVCGTHNRRGIARLALGSVAERVVRASSVPVLTVPGFAFESREQAGERLVMELPRHDLPGAASVVALGLNAVPVADVVARRLGTTLDLWSYVPIELSDNVAGAVGEDELVYYDTAPTVPPAERAAAEARAIETLREELVHVRGTRGFGDMLDRLVVLVGEHLVSAAPVRAAVRALRPLGVSGVVLVTPVAKAAALREARSLADGVVCLEQTFVANPAHVAFRASAPPSYRKVRRLLSMWRNEDSSREPPTRFAS